MRLGIDASNLRAGGGITHLRELLNAANPIEHDFAEVFLWAGQSTVRRLTSRPWLHLVEEPMLDGPLPLRLLWRVTRLPKLATDATCDVLFIPGGGSTTG